MPVPDALKERVNNDQELLNYYYRLARIRNMPEEYKSYDANTGKPIFDVYKYYDVNSRVPKKKELDVVEQYLKERKVDNKESSYQIPTVMTKDLENRVLNDKELNEYLQHLAEIREIPPEYRNYDKNNKPAFDVNKYHDVKAYQDLQEPEESGLEYITRPKRTTLEGMLYMPIPEDLRDRVRDDKYIFEEYNKWDEIGEIPKKYKSFDKNNKPYFDLCKYYHKDKIKSAEEVYPNIKSRLKSIDQIVMDYGKEKKYKTLSKVLSKDELDRLREEGDKNRMEYLRKVYERNEAIKKGADPWSIPIPIPKELLEYTYEETTDIPEMIHVPTLKTITKKDDNIDVALKEYLAEKGLSNVTRNFKKSYDTTTKKESKPKQQVSAIDEYPSTRSKQQKSLADNLGKTTKIKFDDNIDSVMDEYLK